MSNQPISGVAALALSLFAVGLGGVSAQELPPGVWEVRGASGWSQGRCEGTQELEGRLTLAEGQEQGTWVGEITCSPSDRLLLSLNPEEFPQASWLAAELRVRVEGHEEWSPWIPMGRYGAAENLPRSGRCEPWRGVRLSTDVIQAREAPLVAAELRIELARGAAAPRLRRAAIACWSSEAPPENDAGRSPAWGMVTEPPARSQSVEDPAIAGRICSPTSLGMALALHGHDRSTAEVAAGVYDHGADLYGNWSFNVAYAGQLGVDATAVHAQGFRLLEAEIAAGRPVVISHRWREGELQGATHGSSDGHLILVVGFDAQGDVVVHDPAANPRQNEVVRRVYRRSDLRHTWLENADGIAYLLWPARD